MRIVRIVATLGAALLLAGCQTTNVRWVRPGATAADFEADKMRCEYDARLALAPATAAPTYGMGNAIAQGMSLGIERINLMTMCMQTKGWTRQTVSSNEAAEPAAVAAEEEKSPAQVVVPRRNARLTVAGD